MPTETSCGNDALLRAAELCEAGQAAEAAAVLYEAVRRDGDAHAARYRLALIEAQRGKWPEAEHLARTAVECGGDQYGWGLAFILATVGKLDEAQIWLARALARDPRDPRAHALLGSIYADQGKLDEALRCMEHALSIQPDYAPALQRREKIEFLRDVRTACAGLARPRNPDLAPNEPQPEEVDFPSAVVGPDGKPRFVMTLPQSLIFGDLGAAQLFYQEVAGRGYESALRRFLDLHLISDDVFIDVGAHWGIHSLTAATRLPREIDVLAIEAHPENSSRLRSWLERNRLGDAVDLIEAAVGEREGPVYLRLDRSSMAHAVSNPDRNEVGTARIEVAMTTLDRIMADRPRLGWRRIILKIDVEGCELEVLTGARELFSSGHVAAVIWEKGDFFERAVQERRTKAIFEFLNQHGFEHFQFDDERSAEPLTPLPATDAICNVCSLARGFNRMWRHG